MYKYDFDVPSNLQDLHFFKIKFYNEIYHVLLPFYCLLLNIMRNFFYNK
jgi:hypothetical protein